MISKNILDKKAYYSCKLKLFHSYDQNATHSFDWCKTQTKMIPKNNNKNTKFPRESLVCMFDKCSPAAQQSRPAACWRLQQRRFVALLLLGCKFSGWLLSLRIDPLRHLEPRYWHMGRRWAGKSGNLPTLNYDIHRWCHNRGTGLWDTHTHTHTEFVEGLNPFVWALCTKTHTQTHIKQRLSILNST